MACLAVFIFAFILVQSQAKFPNNPKPCEHGDTNCIENLLTFLLTNNTDGYSSLNIIKFEPLRIASINLAQRTNSPVNIDLKFRNSELLGLSQSKVISVKGFGEDLTQQHEIHVRTPVLSLVGDYKITGKVIILPVQGNGKTNVTLLNTDLRFSFTGTPEVKPDGTYLKIKTKHLTVRPKRVYFNFENLFNGDKALGDNMNMFVNDNWQDVFGELQGAIGDAFALVFESVVNNVFQKYPYDKFFA